MKAADKQLTGGDFTVSVKSLKRLSSSTAADDMNLYARLMKEKSDGKTVWLRVADIKDNYDSREESYSQERVDEFEGVFRDDEPSIPVIFVEIMADGSYVLIDGRHRIGGAKQAGRKEVRCMLFTDLIPKERIILSSIINLSKSPLRMTDKDLLMAFKNLAMSVADGGQNTPIKEVRNLYRLCVTPSRLRKLINQLSSYIDDKAMKKALADFSHGMPAKAAAEKYDIDLDTFNKAVMRKLNPKEAEESLSDNEILRGLNGKVTFAFTNIKQQLSRYDIKLKEVWDEDSKNVRTAQALKFYAKMDKNAKSLAEKCAAMLSKFDKAAHLH